MASKKQPQGGPATATNTAVDIISESTENTVSKKTVRPSEMLTDLLTPLSVMLEGLGQGLANLKKVVETPKEMFNAPMEIGVMVLGQDGKSLSLHAARLPSIDVPVKSYIAMVERLHDPHVANVVIQDNRPTDRYQTAKPQIVGHVNPFYSVIAVSVAETGAQLRPGKPANATIRYYIHRHEMAAYYIISKLHQHGMQRLEGIEALLSGWGGCDIPYAIDTMHHLMHREALGGNL